MIVRARSHVIEPLRPSDNFATHGDRNQEPLGEYKKGCFPKIFEMNLHEERDSGKMFAPFVFWPPQSIQRDVLLRGVTASLTEST